MAIDCRPMIVIFFSISVDLFIIGLKWGVMSQGEECVDAHILRFLGTSPKKGENKKYCLES